MKVKKILIISLLIYSCFLSVKYTQAQIVTYNLKQLPKVDDPKLSDLGFIDIDYIPLETNEQSLISGINYVFFHDYSINKIIHGDNYFILKNKNKILKFREDGSFITSIGKIGRGPGEINQVEDMGIDNVNNNVYMVSGWQKKFNIYSSDGEFINTFNVPFYIRGFRFIEDEILCYCGNNRGTNEYGFIVIDKYGHIIKKFRNKNSFISPTGGSIYTHENLFYRYNKTLFVKEIYSDTVFTFENRDFKTHMVIEVGKKLVTPQVRSEYSMVRLYANYIMPLNLLEFGNFVYYAFIYKFATDDVLIYGFIGSKKNDLRVLFNLGQGINNDLDGGPGIIPLTMKDDNTIISMVDALTLKNHVASEEFKNSTPKYPEKKKELEKLAASLKETDNPVLVLVRLKE